jgi:hypothetical protein
MASAGMALRPPGEQTPPDVAQQMREATFTAMAQYTDKFMRSEQFLEMIKQSLDASIAFRKQLNEFLTQAHHGVQSVAKQDVDAMSLAVRHLETRVLGRIEELCSKLDEVSQRLDALESDRAKGNGRAVEPKVKVE